jgi:hypothetical protein
VRLSRAIALIGQCALNGRDACNHQIRSLFALVIRQVRFGEFVEGAERRSLSGLGKLQCLFLGQFRGNGDGAFLP